MQNELSITAPQLKIINLLKEGYKIAGEYNRQGGYRYYATLEDVKLKIDGRSLNALENAKLVSLSDTKKGTVVKLTSTGKKI